jgi:hypothetical protein
MLDDDVRVVVALVAQPVASLREFCAAFLWPNDSSPMLLSEYLSPSEPSILCQLPGLVETDAPGAVSSNVSQSSNAKLPDSWTCTRGS